MLPRPQRLTKGLFAEIIQSGTAIHSKNIWLKYTINHEKGRFSVSVPKKVAKLAVDRNRIRRMMYPAIVVKDGVYGIFFAKNNLKNVNIKEEITSLLSKV